MGYGATFGILGGHGPLGPPKSAYDLTVQSRSMNKGHLQHAILAEPKRMSDAKTPLSADKVKDLKPMLNGPFMHGGLFCPGGRKLSICG